MPREIVHWRVLAEAVEKVRLTSPAVYHCISSNEAIATLGAMAHDAPYYYRFGADPFEQTAEFLHGKEGNDTLLPLRILAATLSADKDTIDKSASWAFILGMVSHAVTDWNFHPMVYHLTGNYYHAQVAERRLARTRHRLFETYLDLWFEQEKQYLDGYNAIRKIPKRQVEKVCQLLDCVVVPEIFPYYAEVSDSLGVVEMMRVTSTSGRWSRSLKYLTSLQKVFRSRVCSYLASGVRRVSGELVAPYEVLFSGHRNLALSRFANPFYYSNPVSGEGAQSTVQEIAGAAATECAELFCVFEPLVAGGSGDSEACLGNIRGKSLNFGLPDASWQKARIFAAHGVELPGLDY